MQVERLFFANVANGCVTCGNLPAREGKSFISHCSWSILQTGFCGVKCSM